MNPTIQEIPLSDREVPKHLLNTLKYPTVFKNILKSWEKMPSSLDEMIERYGDTLLEFRAVSKYNEGIAWESEASYVQASILQFSEWLSHYDYAANSVSSLSQFSKDEYWLYSSYNYLNTTFPMDSEIIKAVNWEILGLTEDIGMQSAFWIGSEGSYTPCHFDSYGCNLVAQICGRKKWILFPPEDISALYPTRIPYEESSVFSSVNILKPDLSKHPNFQNSHPHVVELQAGEILYVPKHWWHFVQSVETSVTINTWFKLSSDKENQIVEAVTKALMTSLIYSFEPEGKSWLNPNEVLVSPQETLEYVIATLKNFSEKAAKNCATLSDEKRPEKIAKLSAHSDVCGDSNVKHYPVESENIFTVIPIPFDQCFKRQDCAASASSSKSMAIEDIINCIIHPDVVSLISKKLMEIK